MNAKTTFATFSAGFLALFVVLFLLNAHWAALVTLAVVAVPVNAVLYRRAQATGRATSH